MWRWNGTAFVRHGWLPNPAGLPVGGRFGAAVAMHEDLMVVGAPDINMFYVYQREQGNWVLRGAVSGHRTHRECRRHHQLVPGLLERHARSPSTEGSGTDGSRTRPSRTPSSPAPRGERTLPSISIASCSAPAYSSRSRSTACRATTSTSATCSSTSPAAPGKSASCCVLASPLPSTTTMSSPATPTPATPTPPTPHRRNLLPEVLAGLLRLDPRAAYPAPRVRGDGAAQFGITNVRKCTSNPSLAKDCQVAPPSKLDSRVPAGYALPVAPIQSAVSRMPSSNGGASG